MHTLNWTSALICFYSTPPKNITDEFTIIRDLCIFLQPALVSYTRYEDKMGHNFQWLEVKN